MIVLGGGVTRRYLDKLMSRSGSPFHASGRAVAVCRHYRVKRERVEVEVDRRVASRVHVCPCCENVYLWVDDTPGPCEVCNPNGGRGGRDLP